MSEEDKHFIKRYEELLDKGYCDCNEMNCIDNNSPRRILNIVKDLQNQLQQKENIIKEVRENLQNSIGSINEKLKNNKEPFEVIDGKIQYLNNYQVIRLKAFKTKCKELLEILDKGSDNYTKEK